MVKILTLTIVTLLASAIDGQQNSMSRVPAEWRPCCGHLWTQRNCSSIDAVTTSPDGTFYVFYRSNYAKVTFNRKNFPNVTEINPISGRWGDLRGPVEHAELANGQMVIKERGGRFFIYTAPETRQVRAVSNCSQVSTLYCTNLNAMFNLGNVQVAFYNTGDTFDIQGTSRGQSRFSLLGVSGTVTAADTFQSVTNRTASVTTGYYFTRSLAACLFSLPTSSMTPLDMLQVPRPDNQWNCLHQNVFLGCPQSFCIWNEVDTMALVREGGLSPVPYVLMYRGNYYWNLDNDRTNRLQYQFPSSQLALSPGAPGNEESFANYPSYLDAMETIWLGDINSDTGPNDQLLIFRGTQVLRSTGYGAPRRFAFPYGRAPFVVDAVYHERSSTNRLFLFSGQDIFAYRITVTRNNVNYAFDRQLRIRDLFRGAPASIDAIFSDYRSGQTYIWKQQWYYRVPTLQWNSTAYVAQPIYGVTGAQTFFVNSPTACNYANLPSYPIIGQFLRAYAPPAAGDPPRPTPRPSVTGNSRTTNSNPGPVTNPVTRPQPTRAPAPGPPTRPVPGPPTNPAPGPPTTAAPGAPTLPPNDGSTPARPSNRNFVAIAVVMVLILASLLLITACVWYRRSNRHARRSPKLERRLQNVQAKPT